ncbi:hypothetical protein M527_24070 [Sphingobium indicum IP26]|nr:hypothetical protein M527_24070 [Sphingobium indicum IP26]EQB08610.1 hypothetical protein L286_01805 [Sphingobium sp. HDIP04]
MKSEIIGRRLEMPQRQVTLSESARDRKPLLPEPCGIARSARGHVPVGVVLPDRYPAQFAQDIFAITTGKASDKNTAIALTDREAWCAISMRRAQAHGGAAMPGATESTYEIDEFLGWSSGCKRHGIPPACMPLPLSLFLPAIRSRSICAPGCVRGSRKRE